MLLWNKMTEEKPQEEEKMEVALCLPVTTEQERELAQQATREFDTGNYDDCLATMSRLATTRPHDLKVMHNRAIAEYYKSGLSQTDEFQHSLKEIYAKVV